MSENEPDPVVMYLVARKSLRMSPGKLAAQVGHAVEYASCDFHKAVYGEACDYDERKRLDGVFREWQRTGSTKITLGADDKAWEKVKVEKARHYLVVDLGKTELPANSEILVGFWPMRKSAASKVLSRLQAIKPLTLSESLEICGAAFGPTVYGLLRDGSQDEWHYDEQLMRDIATAVMEWKERRT